VWADKVPQGLIHSDVYSGKVVDRLTHISQIVIKDFKTIEIGLLKINDF